MRRIILITLTLLALPTAAAPDKLTLQLNWKHQFQFAGYYAAIEQGYYRDAGFDVRLIEADGSSDPIDAVLTGKAAFGVGASELALRRAKGEPVVALAAILQHSPLVLLARKDKSIDNVQDLAGKRIMLMPHETELFAYLKREHAASYRVVPHSFDIGDLVAGRTDALSGYITDEPFALQQARFPYNAFSPRSSGIDFYGDTLFTTEAQIRANPSRVAAFREASLRGWRYAMQHPEEIADLILAKYSRRHSRTHLLFEADEMARLMQIDLVDIGHMLPGRWQHIADTYAELGMLPAESTIDGLIWTPGPRPLPPWVLPAFSAAAVVLLLAFAAAWRFARLNNRLACEIEERRHAESELEGTRRNMAALLDATQSFAALVSRDGTILSINRGGAARFGGTPESITGRHLGEFATDANRAGRQRAMEEALRERRIVVLDDERDGHHLHNTIVPVVGTDGEADRIAVFSEDVTERKIAEAALRTSEERYRLLAENTADVVWQADANLVFTYVNEADEKLRGFPRSEVVGQPLARQLTPDSLATAMRLHAERMEAERRGTPMATTQFELELLCRNGGTVWVEIKSTAMRDENGAIKGFFGISRDITERKAAEAALRDANLQLQRQLHEIVSLHAKLEEMATRDSLTGLYNRRYLDETLDREIA
ncbi:MAG TPA: ABC transporter substrate-binding protein, partial [Nevskia sp.]|nr:ABC transporter substrate-binding protein [Nevskia sp.]